MSAFFDGFRSALAVLRANPLRTMLTALSVALGAGAISLMVSLSKSGAATISHGVESVGGKHLVFLYGHEARETKTPHYDRGLTVEDAVALRGRVPGLADAAFLSAMRKQEMLGNGRKTEVDLAIGSSYRYFLSQTLIHGIDVPDDADNSDARVTVLSETIARELFDTPDQAMGESVVIYGHRYRVIGVTKRASDMGFRMGGVSKERVAFFSAPTMVKHEGLATQGFIVLRDDSSGISHDHILRVTRAIIQARHEGADDFEFFDFATMMGKFERIFAGLRLLTGLIAGVSLFIAGAGIMNVLLASIRQRVQEIGLRRAIGASRGDIRMQFLIESAILAGIGGVVGTTAGIAMTYVAGFGFSQMMPEWITEVSTGAAITAVAVSALAGVTFGLAPAQRAAKLDVVSCLRGELE